MVDRDDDLKLGLKSSAILLGRHDVTGVMAAHGALPRDDDFRRLHAVSRHPLLRFAGGRRVARVLPVPADPGPQPRGLLQGLSQQQLGGTRDLSRGSPSICNSVSRSSEGGWNHRHAVSYQDLRDFIAQLEARGELKRVRAPVDPRLEMTEICDRVLKAQGPALLFEKPAGSRDSRPRQPLRDGPARRAGDGHRRARAERGAARAGKAPRPAQGTRAARAAGRTRGTSCRS